MDKTTAGGLAGVWGLVALAIILGGAGFGAYVDIPSVIIVFVVQFQLLLLNMRVMI